MAELTSPAPLPQDIVIQMVIGGWVSKTIAEVTRLDVPDVLKKNGALTAKDLVEKFGVPAHADSLHRALRACASIGLFMENADGRYGPTPLSDTLTLDSPVSLKRLTESFG
ncbi:MAG: methyltransferase dimerization domain-containing protein, partial [Candidatus Hydrogenedentota bacterium]